MVWGAVIGAGLSIYGGMQQKKANEKAHKAMLAQIAKAQGYLKEGKSAALSAQKKGIKFADESFEKALGVAGTMGAASRGRVLRREQQFRDVADARAADRGFYDSTAALNAQRGVFESTNLTLAGIDESIAGLMSQIHQGRGAMGLQGYSGLAQIEQNFAFKQASVATQLEHQAANVGAGYAAGAQGLAKLLMMYGGGGGGDDGGGGSWPSWWSDALDYVDTQMSENPEVV